MRFNKCVVVRPFVSVVSIPRDSKYYGSDGEGGGRKLRARNILKTLSKFYQKEVVAAVDTMVDLIEPAMIVLLGLGVGSLLCGSSFAGVQLASSI